MPTGDKWRTAIAYGDRDGVYIRGYDLKELVENVGFAESVLLLATGELPSKGAARVLEAMMVSVLDHGIVPSSTITRYLASSGTPLQVAVAGGVMAFGDVYGGASEQLAEALYIHGRNLDDTSSTDAARSAADAIVEHFTKAGKRLPGYGHALHPDGDPRVATLYAIAREEGVAGKYSNLALAVEDSLAERKGRRFPMNQDGAMAAMGLDLGFDWRLVRALAFFPRSAGLAVHALEEMTRESGWRHVPDEQVEYDGPSARSLREGRKDDTGDMDTP